MLDTWHQVQVEQRALSQLRDRRLGWDKKRLELEFDQLTALMPRWTKLDPHPVQQRFFDSPARFKVAACGRRSGKTELAKRRLVKTACTENTIPNAWYILAAPTWAQAKRIYWQDLKQLVPRVYMVRKPSESELAIALWNGATISVIGLDVPSRVEGPILDGIVLDEVADMQPTVWTQHVRPALSTRGREGWATFVGTPEGRNHFYRLALDAQNPAHQPQWEFFTWPSADILSEEEITAARSELDPREFAQEYEASFVTFAGRAYYCFEYNVHAAERVFYSPGRALEFNFDFNVDPGTASVCQDQLHSRYGEISAYIGEVWIPSNSNTPMVCDRLIADWKDIHPRDAEVVINGDPSGGARGTAKTEGSDWDIIVERLGRQWTNITVRVESKDPGQKARVNAMNARLRTADGAVHCLLDPVNCKKLAEDFDGVSVIEGSDGELDKKADPMKTHLSDGACYREHAKLTQHETSVTAW